MGRVIGFVFSAGGPIVALAATALALVRRPSSIAVRRAAIGIALFYLIAGTAIVPYAGSRLLTIGYHQLQPADVPAGRAAIVLLGGGDQFVRGWSDSITVTTPTEAERVLEAARVFRLIAPDWIVSAGGQTDPEGRGLPSAVTMRDELVRMGVPADRIVVEATSRSTRENALHVVPLLKARGIERVVVVTSGSHMRRSLGAFRAVGIDATPAMAPGGGPPSEPSDWMPSTGALEWTGSIARELCGIPYYWLRGWWRR